MKEIIVKCNDCKQDLKGKTQYYDKGKVYCETCNYRKGGEEYPSKK